MKGFSLFGLVQRRLLRVIVDAEGICSHLSVRCRYPEGFTPLLLWILGGCQTGESTQSSVVFTATFGTSKVSRLFDVVILMVF